MNHQQIQNHQHEQQPIQQQPQHNSYVYVECTPNVDSIQDRCQFDIQPNGLHHHAQLNYTTNTLNTIPQYTIQNIHVPNNVQFQAYNLPMQIATTNNILAPIAQMTSGILSIFVLTDLCMFHVFFFFVCV